MCGTLPPSKNGPSPNRTKSTKDPTKIKVESRKDMRRSIWLIIGGESHRPYSTKSMMSQKKWTEPYAVFTMNDSKKGLMES